MNASYEIRVGSLVYEYEGLVAEIYINGRFIGLLSEELGPDQILFELAAGEREARVKVDLDVFEKALAEAKRRLHKLRKIPPVDRK
jgi:hypothetical protein